MTCPAVAQDPTKSPPRVNDPPDPSLQSPRTQGSASVGENISTLGLNVPEVHPLENSAKCSVDEIPKDFLVRCVDNPPDSLGKSRLFQAQDLKAKPFDINDCLAEYEKKSKANEQELYPDFVKATNDTFLCLDSLAIYNTPRLDKSTVYFHVNDPALLEQSHHDLIAKIFWAEELESRKTEPDILKKVFNIIEKNADVKGHVPDMVCYQAFSETSAAKIRGRLGRNTVGCRVLDVIVFRKLKPITDLVGDAFLHTWWVTVKCHLTLWKNGVRHRDISPSNLMYRFVGGKIIGVLNDFDLTLIEDGQTGTERINMVPFMALALPHHRGLEDKIKHAYQHDAESFIWVLTWITLRYANGVFRATDRPLDEWLTVGASTCREKKTDFLNNGDWEDFQPGLGHEQNYKVAKECLTQLFTTLATTARHGVLPVDTAFKDLLHDPVAPFLVPQNDTPSTTH